MGRHTSQMGGQEVKRGLVAEAAILRSLPLFKLCLVVIHKGEKCKKLSKQCCKKWILT